MAYYDLHNIQKFFRSEQIITKEIDAEEILFHAGAEARLIYFVTRGEIRAETYLEDGESIILYRARQGNSLCEENLGLRDYLYTGIAAIPSEVRAISKLDLLEKMQSSWEFTKQLTFCLADRYSNAVMLRELIAVKYADKRLLTWLHWQNVRGLIPLDLHGRLGSIAPELGLTRESVYRALSKLEKEGRIKRDDGIIHLIGL